MNRPFTIVVLLILVLAGFVLWPQQGLVNAKVVTAKADVSAFQKALENFHADCGRYPTAAEGLDALIKRPASVPNDGKWQGPYLGADNVPTDPWGFKYVYRCPGRHNPASFDVFSGGEDTTPGTSDDVGNWTTPDKN